MQEVERRGHPFLKNPGQFIGRGMEWLVFAYSDRWYIKQSHRRELNTFSHLLEEKEDYQILQGYLEQFLPKTYHIRGHDDSGEPCNFIAQQPIIGRPICVLTDEELMQSSVREQLITFLEISLRMWKEIGRIPDLRGREASDAISNTFIDPRNSEHILIEDGTSKLWLVDTSAPQKTFSKKGILGGWRGDNAELRILVFLKKLKGRLGFRDKIRLLFHLDSLQFDK